MNALISDNAITYATVLNLLFPFAIGVIAGLVAYWVCRRERKRVEAFIAKLEDEPPEDSAYAFYPGHFDRKTEFLFSIYRQGRPAFFTSPEGRKAVTDLLDQIAARGEEARLIALAEAVQLKRQEKEAINQINE